MGETPKTALTHRVGARRKGTRTEEKSGKMTLTINNKIYGQLLAKFQPQVITTEKQNEQYLALAETLANKTDLTPEEDRLLELLVVLIEKFEAEQYPLENLSTPLSRLKFLIETNNLKQTDLVEVFGSKGITSEVINGKRSISKQVAIKLGKKFNVDPALFLL